MCHTHVHVCASVSVRLSTCAHVCVVVSVINENKHPLEAFFNLISHALLIYLSNHHYFCPVRLSFYVFIRR